MRGPLSLNHDANHMTLVNVRECDILNKSNCYASSVVPESVGEMLAKISSMLVGPTSISILPSEVTAANVASLPT
jgi:hypothetical protein